MGVDEAGGFGGFVLGGLIGYLLWHLQQAKKRHEDLALQVTFLKSRLDTFIAGATTPATTEAEPEEVTAAPLVPPVSEPDDEVIEQPPVVLDDPTVTVTPPPRTTEPPPADRPPIPQAPHPEKPGMDERLRALLEPAREFFVGGNTLVRAGVVILFIGFAFLVKYAADNDYFPVELRLTATALVGIALTALGWRLRTKRPDFGLAVQGGGIALFYLTIFAAYRLYDLIPSAAAFGLLVAAALFGALIAIMQNAQSLAVLSVLGGFFAPILASSGQGQHVVLFTYFSVLNLGIVLMARHKAWRVLNLVGFFCTFLIMGAWAAQSYQPEFFLSAEPFLVIFFLCYFAISVLHARKRSPDVKGPVDGTLVFGLPVAVFTIQAMIVEPFAYGLAWSALAFGLFYAIAAWVLYQRAPETIRLLVESFAGIGLALGTMTLPFALDASWTGTGWALEGVALVWLGIRQKRALLRASGVLLQLAAAVAFIEGMQALPAGAWPLLNRFYMGCLALSVAAFGTAYLMQARGAERMQWERIAGPLFLAIGLLWWLVGGSHEIIEHVNREEWALHALIAFYAATAMACMALGERLSWAGMRRPALLLLPVLYLFLFPSLFLVDHPIEAGGWAAWIFAIAVYYVALYRTEGTLKPWLRRFLHAATLWLVLVLASWEVFWIADTNSWNGIWPLLVPALPPIVALFAVTGAATGHRWPFGVQREAYLKTALIPVIAALWYWSVYLVAITPADPTPLPYVPLLNPLDISLGFFALGVVSWYRTAQRVLDGFGAPQGWRVLLWGLTATVFVWLNASLARSVHHLLEVPYNLEALWATTAFQTALTIFWTAVGVSVMAVAARRGTRTPWIVAAALLVLVVVKLFAVDLSSVGTVARIVTFIVVGLLLLLVGYLAPVPPARPAPVGTPAPEDPPHEPEAVV